MLHIFVITKSVSFSLLLFICRVTVKAAVFDGIPDLTGLVDVSVYDTKPVHFPSMCCNAIKWVQKTRQVYDPKQRWYMTLTFCV